MAKFGIASGPSGARRKLATALAAAGALLLSSGMVMAAAPGAVAAPKDDNPGAAAKPNKGQGNNNGGGNNGGGNNAGGNNGGGNNAGGNNGGGQSGNGNGGNAGGGATKFYVCKWVGQPEVGDAAHHIVPVSGSPLQDGGWFNDQQGPSYVLEQGVEPSLENCPLFGGGGGGVGDTASLVILDWAPNDCRTDGYVREPVSANVQYMIDGGEDWTVREGVHIVTATITNGATGFTGTAAGWTVTGTTATRTIDLLSDEECTGLDVSVDRIAKCGEWGSIVAGPTTGVSYTSSAGKWTGLEGDVTVTATVTHNRYKLPASLSGWDVASDRSFATRTYSLGSYSKCSTVGDDDSTADPTLVSPRYPSTTDATCSRDGRLVVPNQPQGVRMERTGSVPGTVTFTFSPAEGYAFPNGTDREVSLEVEAQLTGTDCIKGVETVRPNPQPGNGPAAGPVNGGTDAEVLGEQAVAVPTAVAAGLGDTMTAASTTGSPQLAQALVAGGLLMLVAGGATGLGRRTRGAHES